MLSNKKVQDSSEYIEGLDYRIRQKGMMKIRKKMKI